MSAMSETFGCGKEGANALIAKNPGVSAAGGGWYGADKLWSRPAGTEGFGNETRGTTLSTKHGFFCFGFCFHCFHCFHFHCAFCSLSLSFSFSFPPFPCFLCFFFPLSPVHCPGGRLVRNDGWAPMMGLEDTAARGANAAKFLSRGIMSKLPSWVPTSDTARQVKEGMKVLGTSHPGMAFNPNYIKANAVISIPPSW
jgi:hypothetical protein